MSASTDDGIELSLWVQTSEPRQWVRTLTGADPADTFAWRARIWRAASVYDPDELLDAPHLPRDGGWLCCSTSKGPDGLGYLLPEDQVST